MSAITDAIKLIERLAIMNEMGAIPANVAGTGRALRILSSRLRVLANEPVGLWLCKCGFNPDDCAQLDPAECAQMQQRHILMDVPHPSQGGPPYRREERVGRPARSNVGLHWWNFRCSECGQAIRTNGEREWGHDSACPLIGD